MTTVLAAHPEGAAMASAIFGRALIAAFVIERRSYVLVAGEVPDTTLVFDGELIVEVHRFATVAQARAWVDADVAQRRRPF